MILRFVFKNIMAKPLRNILVVVSCTISIAMMLIMVNINKQIDNQFINARSSYQLVIGATGSKTELVLDSLFYNDMPQSTLDYSYYESLLNDTRVKTAIPMAMGDNINGYKIIGITPQYLKSYAIMEGSGLSDYDYENPVIIAGYTAAENLGITLGEKYSGSHTEHNDGDEEETHQHTQYKYTATGILQKTGTAVDNAIFTHIQSVWAVHSTGESGNEITGKMTAILINAETGADMISLLNDEIYFNDSNVMVVSVGDTLGDVMALFGSAGEILEIVIAVVIIMAFNMLFLTMFISAGERKREVAVLRAIGSNRLRILFTILLEAVFIAVTSAISAVYVSFIGLAVIGNVFTGMLGTTILPLKFFVEELFIIFGSVIVALIATIIPALMVYKTEPTKYLR